MTTTQNASRSGRRSIGEATLPTDGRVARRVRNRARVIDAYVQSLQEGEFCPSAADLAERSGVTTRTVHRYIREDPALKAAVAMRVVELLQSVTLIDEPGVTSLQDRIDAYVRFRIDLFTLSSPVVRTIRIELATDPILVEITQAVRRAFRSQLCTLFSPELFMCEPTDREVRVLAIETLFLFDSLDHLHHKVAGAETSVREVLVSHTHATLTSTFSCHVDTYRTA